MDWSKPFSHVEDPTCWQIGRNKFFRARSRRATRQSIPITAKFDLVCQHASKDRGAATAGRVANQERQRIERSEVIQSGQVLAARQVGGRETDQASQRNCQTSRNGTRGRLCRLCRSEFDTRGLDQEQTTLEQLWSRPRKARNS
jgi:hypothetical protein